MTDTTDLRPPDGPPTCRQVQQLLDTHDTVNPTVLAQLALLPQQTVPATAVQMTADGWTWRNHTIGHSGRQLGDLRQLAQAGRQPGDTWADPNNPIQMLRIVRSGHRQIVFGATELLGIEVTADPGVPPKDIRAVCQQLHNQPDSQLPHGADSDSHGNIHLQADDDLPADPTVRDRQLQRRSRQLTGQLTEVFGVPFDIAQFGHTGDLLDIELVADLDGSWQLCIPLLVADTSHLIGVPPQRHTDQLPNLPADAIGRLDRTFRLLGGDRHDPATAVALHTPSDIRVLLTNTN